MYATFETNRLNVSPLTTLDADFMADLVNSEGWLRFIGDRNVHNAMQALAYVQKVLDKPLCFYNVIRLKDQGTSIGIVSFIKRDTQKHYDIGFALLPKYEGKGYIFEATSKYLDLISKTGVHEEIVAITMKDNLKSISLLEKLGLRFVKDYNENAEDMQLYSIKLSGVPF